jgi:single-strand DNA-binding protein
MHKLFDIRGREYNGRYFNNLVGWKVLKPDSCVGTEPPFLVGGNSDEPFDVDGDVLF